MASRGAAGFLAFIFGLIFTLLPARDADAVTSCGFPYETATEAFNACWAAIPVYTAANTNPARLPYICVRDGSYSYMLKDNLNTGHQSYLFCIWDDPDENPEDPEDPEDPPQCEAGQTTSMSPTEFPPAQICNNDCAYSYTGTGSEGELIYTSTGADCSGTEEPPPCEGPDCGEPPCEGPDCGEPPCEGPDCGEPPCEGSDCGEPPCEGPDCGEPPCTGPDCGEPPCTGSGCDPIDPPPCIPGVDCGPSGGGGGDPGPGTDDDDPWECVENPQACIDDDEDGDDEEEDPEPECDSNPETPAPPCECEDNPATPEDECAEEEEEEGIRAGPEGCDVTVASCSDMGAVECQILQRTHRTHCATVRVKELIEKRTSSGGASCDDMPQCDGDKIDCNVLHQVWRSRCRSRLETEGVCTPTEVKPPVCVGDKRECLQSDAAWEIKCRTRLITVDTGEPGPDPVEYLGEPGTPPGTTPTVVDVGTLDMSGLGWSRSCPEPPTIDALGMSMTVNMDIWCDWGEVVAAFVLMLAAVASLRIIVGA